MSAKDVKKKAKAAEGKAAKTEKKDKAVKKVKKRKLKGSSKRVIMKKKVKKRKIIVKKSKSASAAKKSGAEKKSKKKGAKTENQKKLDKVKEKIGKKLRASFKGRFGARSVRNVSKKKWQKWRLPRGIDIKKKREQGIWPSTGYRTIKSIRDLHPSGFEVVRVNNAKEVAAVAEGMAVIIGATVGRKKRVEIVKEAAKRKVKLLNARRG